ncbi:MAG: YiiX/YebB-like N1pC/P60 family cysteine hydrolase [Halioglobus sp.]|nr:YiiX/YebB-like N1pC/P60 family cysteine hydrolase [Halioglobus sp.]
MNIVSQRLGLWLAKFLSQPRSHYERFSVLTQAQLDDALEPGDLLLVEGNSRISTAIKYLTQSTWSHVCMFAGKGADGKGFVIEADLVEGVIRSPLEKYANCNTRICRAVNLTEQDRLATLQYALDRVGLRYDTKNIVDLVRYLLPMPPVPTRYRRRLIQLGSGDPTSAICSTLIAQAFQSVRYPIIPHETPEIQGNSSITYSAARLEPKHYSHFTPRDFDLSPYFEIVKPTIQNNFDYKKIQWAKPETNFRGNDDD